MGLDNCFLNVLLYFNLLVSLEVAAVVAAEFLYFRLKDHSLLCRRNKTRICSPIAIVGRLILFLQSSLPLLLEVGKLAATTNALVCSIRLNLLFNRCFVVVHHQTKFSAHINVEISQSLYFRLLTSQKFRQKEFLIFESKFRMLPSKFLHERL